MNKFGMPCIVLLFLGWGFLGNEALAQSDTTFWKNGMPREIVHYYDDLENDDARSDEQPRIRLKDEYDRRFRTLLRTDYWFEGQIRTIKRFRLVAEDEMMAVGKFVTLAPDGKMIGYTHYRNGKRHGKSVEYYMNGGIKHNSKYKHDHIAKEKCFDPDGNVLDCKEVMKGAGFEE